MMNAYLVTGGAGFIGSNFIKILLEKDSSSTIVCLDKLTYSGDLKNLEPELKSKNFSFVKGNIADSKVVSDIFKKFGIDTVVNFAAESHVDRSIDDPQIFLTTNILGTHNLLKVARRFWEKSENNYKKSTRFLQISTDEVYGSIEKGKFLESTPLSPRSPYAASKAGADLIVKSYIDTYRFPAVISRCSNNYGPYQFPEKVIPLMINNILKGETLPVYGQGKNVRDWIYVTDHCLALIQLLKQGKIGEIYNIGGNFEISNIELVRTLIRRMYGLVSTSEKYRKKLKIPAEKISENLIRFVKDRPGHDYRYAMDTKKIEKLGFKPKHDFNRGIQETVEWYFNHMDWLQDIVSGEYKQYYRKMYGDR